MADFHFFSHSAALKGSSTSGTYSNGGIPFGPDSADRYFVSTMFEAHANYTGSTQGRPPAIAITDGQIFCLEVPNSNTSYDNSKENKLVDIILKPTPGSTPKWCPKVKYFIYRSVLKESLVKTSQSATDYEFSDDVIDSAMDDKFIIPDNLGLKLGVNLGASFFSVDSDTPLDLTKRIDYIFDSNFDNINIVQVSAGDQIGLFPSNLQFGIVNNSLNKFGLDILIDQQFYNPNIDEIIRGYSGTPTNNEQHTYRANRIYFDPSDSLIENKFKAEKVKAYLDAAAFYGSFTTAVIAGSTEDQLFENGTAIEFDETENKFKSFYERIFIGTQNLTNNSGENKYLFENKNRLYFDIRDETGLSVNISNRYHNGTDEFHVRCDWKEHVISGTLIDLPSQMLRNAPSNRVYPVLFLDNNSSFNSQPPNLYEVPHADINVANGNEVHLGLSFRKHLNDTEHEFKYSAIVDFGNIEGKSAEPLRIPLDINSTDTNSFCEEIVFQLPHYKLLTSTNGDNLYPICQYVKITLVAHNVKVVNESNVNLNKNYLEPIEYFDHIIPLSIVDTLPSKPSLSNVSTIIERATYFNNLRMDGSDGMGNVCMSYNHTTNNSSPAYVTFTSYVPKKLGRNERANKLDKLVVDSGFGRTVSQEQEKANYIPKVVKLINNQQADPLYDIVDHNNSISINGVTQNIIEKVLVDENGFTQQEASYLEGLYYFQMERTVFDSNSFQNLLSPYLASYSTFFAFKFKEFGTSGTTSYAKFELCLRGYTENTTTNKLEILESICSNCYIYITRQGYDISRDQAFINTNRGKQHIDYTQVVNTSQVLENEQKSVHSYTNTGNLHNINSNIAWVRGVFNSTTNQIDFEDHFDGVVKSIFNTNSNPGIAHLFSASESLNITLTYRNAYPGEMLRVIPEFGYFSLFKRDHFQRAMVNELTGKAGILYIPSSYSSQQDIFDEIDVTVAHEFSHMLGLADRYAYIGRVFDNGNFWEVEDEVTPRGVSIDIGSDIGYSDQYRWHYNLMGGGELFVGTSVALNNSPFINETTFLTTYQPLIIQGSAPTYSRLTSFISQKQWDIIKNNNREEEDGTSAQRIVFFQKTLVNNADYAKVTFINVGYTKSDPHSQDVLYSGTNSPSMSSRNTFNSNTNVVFGWMLFQGLSTVLAETSSAVGKDNYRDGGLINQSNVVKVMRRDIPSAINLDAENEFFARGSSIADYRGNEIDSDNYAEFLKIRTSDLIQKGGEYLYNDPETITSGSYSHPNGRTIISYDSHGNRIAILKLLGVGGV